jgi:translation initiation factor 6
MEAVKYRIMGSDYLGVFATATDKYLFAGAGLTEHNKQILTKTFGVKCIEFRISGSDLIGLFAKANSNGIMLSNLALDYEIAELKKNALGINVGAFGSDLNALGSNILLNDKVAIVNPDYSQEETKEMADIFDVEIIKMESGGFKTVGANNILTNRGLVINNRASDKEKEEFDRLTGFNSMRTTANTGSLSIGLAVVANSKAVVAGDSTTGYELSRIVDGLE